MARPKSEDKRRAILDAAARIFAERGVSESPTSAISKAAGVAEGTLFTYFKSKEELMNALYLDFRREYVERIADFPRKGSVRSQLRYLWDEFLAIGTENPARLRVQTRLRASGKLFRENETPIPAILEMMKTIRKAAGSANLRSVEPEYVVLLMRSMAEATIEYIAAHPESKKECWEAGFLVFWKGLSGK